MFCRSCGTPNEEGGKFCVYCGTALTPPPAAPEAAPVPAEAAVPAAEPAKPEKKAKKQKEPKPEKPKKEKKPSAVGKVLLAVLLTFVVTGAAAVVLHSTGLLDTLIPTRNPGQAEEKPDSSREEEKESDDPKTEPEAEAEAVPQEQQRVAFSAPEDAVAHFLRGFLDQDLGRMLEARDAEELLEYLDGEAYLEKLRAVSIAYPIKADNPLILACLEENVANNTARWALAAINSCLAPVSEVAATVTTGQTRMLQEDEVSDYVRLLEEFSLQEAELGFVEYELDQDQRDRLLYTVGDTHGVSDVREFVFLLRVEDAYFIGGLTAYEYQSGWKIGNMAALTAGTSAMGLYWYEDLQGMSTEDALAVLEDEFGDEYSFEDVTILD